MFEVRFHDTPDDRRELAVKMFLDEIASKLGGETARSYEADVEYLEYALVDFADKWKEVV